MVSGALSEVLNWYSSCTIASQMIRRHLKYCANGWCGYLAFRPVTGELIHFSPLDKASRLATSVNISDQFLVTEPPDSQVGSMRDGY